MLNNIVSIYSRIIQSEKSVHTMVFQMNIITETYVGKRILKMNKNIHLSHCQTICRIHQEMSSTETGFLCVAHVEVRRKKENTPQ